MLKQPKNEKRKKKEKKKRKKKKKEKKVAATTTDMGRNIFLYTSQTLPLLNMKNHLILMLSCAV